MRIASITEGERAAADYPLLRAGLQAAQSATATARAHARLDRPARQAAALAGLLGDLPRDAGRGCWLRGSFATVRDAAGGAACAPSRQT